MMSDGFPMVALRDILTKSEEWIDIEPEEHYKQITVKLWGKGVVQRDEVSGVEIAATKRIIVKPQQFILSKIDARNGAFGLIPDTLNEAVVSSDFPVFTLNTAKVFPKFLDWMSKTSDFIALCNAASGGTTNRIRLKEGKFLAMYIPLPPLPDQRRIVARIEELASRIEEARGLRREAMKEGEKLLSSAVSQGLAAVRGDTREVTVMDVAYSVTDGDHQPPPKADFGIPFIFRHGSK